MRRRLIAGNWKMHGLRSDAQRLAETIVQGAATVERELLVCPPTTLLDAVSRVLDGSPVGLGAQDCHAAPSGAHTGDVSAEMLADLGCRYVIVGHSERRTDYGETDATVRAKAAAAHRAGLIAIVCVGESAEERDRGETLAVVARQLTGSLPENASPANSVVAYEPVWAIGTGRTASPGDIAEVHGALRGLLAGRASEASDTAILYGGSVKPGNAPEILSLADVDGALVGGASLNAESFLAIAAS